VLGVAYQEIPEEQEIDMNVFQESVSLNWLCSVHGSRASFGDGFGGLLNRKACTYMIGGSGLGSFIG
jgi:hypothetical protein